jgi:hypothetical protein
MVAFVKYNCFVNEVSLGGHNLQADVIKAALSNTAPANPLTETVWNTTNYPAPAAANNYTAGGYTMTNSSAAAAAYLFKMILADAVVTATAGGIGPFRYVILYNSSKTNKLVGYYDYGSSITLADTETFTIDADPTNGVVQINMTP